jgi:serine/threonine protein kinase
MAVYERIWTQLSPDRTHFFAEWFARGRITCSSIFPSGWFLVIQYRKGSQLSTVWPVLTYSERQYIQTQCLDALNTLRQIALRLDDPGLHNMLYDRESRRVTLLDFEIAHEVLPNTSISVRYEMGLIFGLDNMIVRSTGG